MAGPVGHIVCALALLNSGNLAVGPDKAFDHNEFFSGTSWPDSRYFNGLNRTDTHKLAHSGLREVISAETSFEAGRRFHVFVDVEREKHMRQHNAYRFIKNGPFKTQMLKIVEDHILFNKLKGNFEPDAVFSSIYDGHRSYSVKESSIKDWNNLLATYLNQSHWFNFMRYYKTLVALHEMHDSRIKVFGGLWQTLKAFGFLIHAYAQIEMLSRNKELKAIILDFYENKIDGLIKSHIHAMKEQTTAHLGRAPPAP